MKVNLNKNLPENKINKSLQVNDKVKRILSPHKERAVLSALKGSITVEAAMVLPIFIFVIISIVALLLLFLFHNALQIDMDNTARELSVIQTGLKEHERIADVYSIGRILSEKTGKVAGVCGIYGGRYGINFTGSDLASESGIKTIRAEYMWKSPQKYFCFEQKSCYIAWTGKSLVDNTEENNDEMTVYMTENGTVYHTDKNCTYLTREIKRVNIKDVSNYRNLGGGKYYPCEKCEASHCEGNEVYITVYGTRYHKDRECNVLKRYIKELKISEIKGIRKCKKCGHGG